jgi:hypothetical protein
MVEIGRFLSYDIEQALVDEVHGNPINWKMVFVGLRYMEVLTG